MNDIVSAEVPKKKRQRPRRAPVSKPSSYWVRWSPQTHGRVTAWYEVLALEKYDRTHRTIHSEKGKRGARYFLGRIGTSRLEYPSDKVIEKMPNPQVYLRERIVAESDRAKNFIDYILTQNGVIIDERWKWVWPDSCYYVMTNEPPFPEEGFRGGRYTGLRP